MHFVDLLTLLFIAFSFVACLPTESISEIKPEFKDEKRYPNGTVVGKYVYLDKEGNPVHVQYFADDSSYGVELKSVKVLNEAEPKDLDVFSNTLSTPFKLATDILKIKYYDFDNHPVDEPSLTKQSNKEDSLKSDVNHADYETLYSTEYKSFKNNGKDKIRIYSNKARKTRNALDYDSILFY